MKDDSSTSANAMSLAPDRIALASAMNLKVSAQEFESEKIRRVKEKRLDSYQPIARPQHHPFYTPGSNVSRYANITDDEARSQHAADEKAAKVYRDNQEKTEANIADRIDSLMARHSVISKDPDCWKILALSLAAEHEKAFRLRQEVEPRFRRLPTHALAFDLYARLRTADEIEAKRVGVRPKSADQIISEVIHRLEKEARERDQKLGTNEFKRIDFEALSRAIQRQKNAPERTDQGTLTKDMHELLDREYLMRLLLKGAERLMAGPLRESSGGDIEA